MSGRTIFRGFADGELIVKDADTLEEAKGHFTSELNSSENCRIEEVAVGGTMGAGIRVWNYDGEIQEWVESI